TTVFLGTFLGATGVLVRLLSVGFRIGVRRGGIRTSLRAELLLPIEKRVLGNVHGDLTVHRATADGRLELVAQTLDRCRSPLRILLEGPGEHGTQTLGNLREVRRLREVLHQDLARRFAVERYFTREHLVQDHAERVDIDLATVAAAGDFRSHV